VFSLLVRVNEPLSAEAVVKLSVAALSSAATRLAIENVIAKAAANETLRLNNVFFTINPPF